VTTHAIDSPSSLARRKLCPGSRRMEIPFVGEDTGSEASRDGTHTHTLIEICHGRAIDDARQLLGARMEDHDGEFVVDEERADRANHMIHYMRDRAVELGPQIAVRAEVKCDPGKWLRRDNMAGTSDGVLVGNNVLEIVDYKDGWQYVPVEDNDQTIGYLMGVLADYVPTLDFEQAPFSRYFTTIVQPKNVENPDSNGQIVNRVEYTVEELTQWVRDTRLRLQEADEPDAKLIPGDKQCMFCDARGVCLERAKVALKGVTFPVVGEEATIDQRLEVTEKLADLRIETLSVPQIESFLDGEAVMLKVLKDVRAHATRMAQQGVKFKDRILVNTYGNRAWSLPDEEVAKKLKNRKLKEADIFDKKLKSPTQILKSKKLEAKQKTRLEKELVTKPHTGVKLVLASEGGEAAEVGVPDGMFPNTKSPQGDSQPQLPAFMTPPAN